MSPRRPRQAPPETSAAHARRLMLALLGWGAVLAASWLGARPPAPLGEEASPRAFSAGRAAAVLDGLLDGVGPHPTGTPAAATVRERLLTRLRRLGYEPQVQERFACGPDRSCATVRNVLARRHGTDARPAVLLVAHYDSVAAGPGWGDDGAGVAALLELARLGAEERGARRTWILLFSDGEEDGLIGASAFAEAHPWMEEVGVVLNLEARGSSGPGYLFETGRDDRGLVGLYGARAARPTFSSLSVEIYRRMPNDTDFSVFRERELLGLNFAFIGDAHTYHTPLDDREHLSLASLQHMGDQVLAALEGLEHGDPADGAGDAVGVSLFGRWLVRYPSWLAPLLGALAALGVVVGTQRAARVGRVGWWSVLGGAVAAVALASAAVGLGVALQAGLVRATGSPAPWHASPSPTGIALVGAVLATYAALARPVGRMLGAAGLTHGVWVLWAMAALYLGLFSPGMSFLAALPALGLALVAGGVRLDGAHGARLARGSLFALLVAAAVWGPTQLGLVQAFGVGAGRAVTVPLALVGTLALPFFPLAPAGLAVGLCGTGLACVVFGGAMTFVLPHETAEVPGRLNLVYEQGSAGAEWHALTFGAPVPAALRAAAEFGTEGHGSHSAPAPDLGLPGARIEVSALRWVEPPAKDEAEVDAQVAEATGDEAEPLRRLHVEGRLRSPLGGHWTQIQGSGWWSVAGLVAEGVPVSPYTVFVEVGPEGVAVEFDLVPLASPLRERLLEPLDPDDPAREAAETPSVVLADHAPGLPPEGQALAAARPASWVPSHRGDLRVVIREQRFEPDQ